ncbi:MAG: hypothetical protein D6740_01480 [Alphaproteobacteria bacterium]|nr:MAG: hypothetical protein D6740_01480 [Alphaproteobacteria bacterium]
MGRLVTPEAAPSAAAFAEKVPQEATGAEAPDNYLARLAKYIPAEIIGAYLAAEKILGTGSSDRLLAIATLAAFTLLTPIYFSMLPGPAHCKRLHMIISTLAFLVWSYALPGSAWISLDLSNPRIAGILLIVSSLVFGAIKPPPSDNSTEGNEKGEPPSPLAEPERSPE